MGSDWDPFKIIGSDSGSSSWGYDTSWASGDSNGSGHWDTSWSSGGTASGSSGHWDTSWSSGSGSSGGWGHSTDPQLNHGQRPLNNWGHEPHNFYSSGSSLTSKAQGSFVFSPETAWGKPNTGVFRVDPWFKKS